MWSNYLKTSLRNLARNKAYSSINILGLSLGIVCSMVIFLIIRFELSFNRYYKDLDQIYRLVRTTNVFGEIKHDPGVPFPLPEALRNDFPQVEYLSIVDRNHGSAVFSVTDKDGTPLRYKEEAETVAFVNPDFFRIFTYEWLAGNPETALQNPRSMVISSSLAKKYFGDADPIGRMLTYDNVVQFQVSGVVRDAPQNTDLPLKVLIPFDPKENGSDNWSSVSSAVQCYVKLPPQASPGEIDKQLKDFVTRHFDKEDAETTVLNLQSLADVHFDPRFKVFSDHVIAKERLLTLGLIGLFLLLTACINFVNLNTALAVKRSKELGVRKVLGSSILRLMLQFIGETSIVTLIALFISLALVEVALSQLQSILAYHLHLDLTADAGAIWFLAALFVLVTLAAGFYPALHLARFQPITAIRNKLTASYGEGLALRKTLVVLQFAISQVMIVCTIVISSQLKFFTSADMGFNKEAVVELELPENDDASLQRFRQILLSNSGVKHVAFSNTGTASGNVWTGNYKLSRDGQLHEGRAHVKFIDDAFLDTYEVRLLAGEGLSPGDTLKRFLVSEAFARDAGYGDDYAGVLGKQVKVWGKTAPIVGIVNDFNTRSLREPLGPIILIMQNRYYLAGIKVSTHDLPATLAAIEGAWDDVFPEFIFEYSFLDENIADFYENEKRTANLINTFTTIAILIGCLGLLGLVSYMTTQRTKEIGIRKVLGATFAHMVGLFTRELTILISIAFVVAAPMAYYFMTAWLQEFAYRIELGVGIFAAALAASFLISFLTIGYRTVRAVLANPVEALRYE